MPKMGKLITENEYKGAEHDLTPWVEVNSSRMKAIRFDHATQAIHVEWGNGNPAYIYRDAGYETFRRMIRAASKGKFINRVLNGYSYGPMDTDEMDLPANPDRQVPLSGARNIVR